MTTPEEQRKEYLQFIEDCEKKIAELQKEIHFKRKYVRLLDREIEERKETQPSENG